MNTATFLKFAAMTTLASSIMACSSNPKVVEPAPEPELAAATATEIVNTPRGPSLTLQDVLFDFDEATLRPEANGTIAQAAVYLKDNPQRTALVEGHTDHTGDEDFNQSLSVKRSQAIKEALVAKGVSSYRIKSIGMGETRPIADNKTSAGRQANRRVEIVFELAGG